MNEENLEIQVPVKEALQIIRVVKGEEHGDFSGGWMVRNDGAVNSCF